MPEGHSVHRIARQFSLHFVGKPIAVSSPQGRFAEGATRIDGQRLVDAKAVGKQLFLEFESGLWLRVHLGLYGAWDFAGDITADATTASANGRMGQTNQRGTILDPSTGLDPSKGSWRADDNEDSLTSIGAPRRARLRMSEQETLQQAEGPGQDAFPAAPIGAVRARLLADDAVADLRGPTACEVLTPEETERALARLGPDPLVDEDGEERFVRAVRAKATPIALLLMDQSVVSGIGNVYRAELLFRARLEPHTPGRQLAEQTVRALWRDWAHLLEIGVRTGQMLTMDDLSDEDYRKALAHRDDRHWVYHRTGLPCRVCGTNIAMEELGGRKLYWCPTDQTATT